MAGAGDPFGYSDNRYIPGSPFPGMANATYNRSAFGRRPVGATATSTIGSVGPQGIGAGQAVYNQLPGYSATLGNIGKNVQSETAGELPADVVRQLTQRAAERGVAIGAPGSDNANASLLQSLGLTSLDLTRQGQAGFESILPHLPGYNIANNPAFYLTPGQKYESELQSNIFSAMPDPYESAMAGLKAAQSGFGAGMGSVGGGGGYRDRGLNFGQPMVGYGSDYYSPLSASGPSGYSVIGGKQVADNLGPQYGGYNDDLMRMLEEYDVSQPTVTPP